MYFVAFKTQGFCPHVFSQKTPTERRFENWTENSVPRGDKDVYKTYEEDDARAEEEFVSQVGRDGRCEFSVDANGRWPIIFG